MGIVTDIFYLAQYHVVLATWLKNKGLCAKFMKTKIIHMKLLELSSSFSFLEYTDLGHNFQCTSGFFKRKSLSILKMRKGVAERQNESH